MTCPLEDERSPFLRAFGSLAPCIVESLRTRPSLALRLALAPREAMHASACFLHLAEEAHGPVPEVAEMIEAMDPRDLLRIAIPEEPPRLYRALATAGDHAFSRATYVSLRDIVAGPMAGALLRGDLTKRRIEYFATFSEAGPAVQRLCLTLPEGAYALGAVTTVVSYLIAHGIDVERELVVPHHGGPRAVVRRVQTMLDGLVAPDPGFALPPPLRMATTVGALRRVGRAFQNCLGNLPYDGPENWLRLVDGSTVYVTSDEPLFVAAIQRRGPSMWTIEQIGGPKNAEVGDAAKAMIISAFRTAGQQVVEISPRHALSRLYYLCRRDAGIDAKDMTGDFALNALEDAAA